MSTYLPAELIANIFSRLPVKSLIRFKNLSRTCRDQIQSPHFINCHLERSPDQFLVLRNQKIQLFDRDSDNSIRYDIGDYSFFYFVGSCNGLVCLFDVQDNIVICNVGTREHLMIPYPSNSDDRRAYGFGYDAVGDDYKVVLIESFCDSETEIVTSGLMVYSLKQNKWTRRVNALYSFVNNKGVLVNGFMHWAIFSNPKRVIVVFDLHFEGFCAQVPLPDSTIRVLDVGVLGGCLLMIDEKSYQVRLTDEIGVWVMKDYMIKDSWTRIYSLHHVYISCAISDDSPLIPLSKGLNYWQKYRTEKNGKTHIVGCWLVVSNTEVYRESLIQISAYAGLPGTRGQPTMQVRGRGRGRGSSSNERIM